MRRFTTNDLCVYCQRSPAMPGVGDHVIARGFFPTSRRVNEYSPIRVPACRPCNLEKSRDEEIVIRELMLSKPHCYHPAAQELLAGTSGIVGAGSAGRSLLYEPGQKWIKRYMQTLQTLSVYSPGGIYQGDVMVHMMDRRICHRLMYRIMLGLLYAETGQYLQSSYSSFVRPNFAATQLQEPQYQFIFEHPAKIFGNGVFSYIFAPPSSEKEIGTWLFSFYESFLVYGAIICN